MLLSGFLDAQRGWLFPWAAVFYGAGIAVYFALPHEPTTWAWALVAAIAFGCAVLAIWQGPVWRPLTLAILLPALGFGVAAWRTASVAEVTLGFRYYGPVEGRVIAIDRSQSDAVRLTLDRVVLARTSPDRTPARVRVSLHGDFLNARVAPGALVGLTGHLSPPSGPVEPGGYDFRRHAWFKGLGAVGYTRNPVVTFAPPERGPALFVLRLRLRIADGIRTVLPSEEGGFAAAITTGDRSTLDQTTLEALQATNLAHLLAISGLHMGLLTGFVFGALRLGLTSIPRISLGWPVKKIAAVGALVAGAGYLVLSGNAVATERAFVMVAVMLSAVLVDRRAITLRAVALAALIVLTARPETLMGPGFQMSFAATTALVTVYGWMRERDWSESRWPWPLRLVGGVALSSAVAGLATAPIAAAHFNQIPHFGLLANILSVPLMGMVIVPGAVLAALLWPVGLSWVGLLIMEPAIAWILWIAREVAAWPGALSFVPTPGDVVLPLIAISGLSGACLRGRGRLAALPLAGVVFLIWGETERPAILISDRGGQIGVMRDGERALSRPRGDGFAASSWLENDGDGAEQAAAAARAGWSVKENVRLYWANGLQIVHGTGKRGSAEALVYCGDALIVVNTPVEAPDTCWLYDATRLRSSGAVAVTFVDGTPRVTETSVPGRGRPWSQ